MLYNLSPLPKVIHENIKLQAAIHVISLIFEIFFPSSTDDIIQIF